MVRMATTGILAASDSTELTVRADSICVHGDTPGAVDMAMSVRRALAESGVDIRPFVA